MTIFSHESYRMTHILYIATIKQKLFERVQEVGNPLVTLLFTGSFPHGDNALWYLFLSITDPRRALQLVDIRSCGFRRRENLKETMVRFNIKKFFFKMIFPVVALLGSSSQMLAQITLRAKSEPQQPSNIKRTQYFTTKRRLMINFALFSLVVTYVLWYMYNRKTIRFTLKTQIKSPKLQACLANLSI